MDLLLNFPPAENQNGRVGWKDYQASDCEWAVPFINLS